MHPCKYCGSNCHCVETGDHLTINSTPTCCQGCGCQLDDYDEDEFSPCSKCDGHAACEDFGCAFELGLGKLINK
jgi:hypothetical protein